MRERTEIYEREKLYEEVWKEPVLVVAKRYGVMDVIFRSMAWPWTARYWRRRLSSEDPKGLSPRRGFSSGHQ